jgi:hypothetical protein
MKSGGVENSLNLPLFSKKYLLKFFVPKPFLL